MIGVLYGLFGLVIVIDLLVNIKRHIFNSSVIINAGLVMYYIIPNLRQIYIGQGNYLSSIELGHNITIQSSYFALINIIIFYGVFKFANSKIKIHSKITKKMIINQEKTMIRVSIYITFFSLIIFLLYAQLYGGILPLLSNISNIRSGDFATETGRFDFLNKLYRVIPFALYFSIPYFNRIKNYRIHFYFIIFIALIIGISTGGRGFMLQLFLVLILGKMLSKKRSFTLKYLTVILISIIFFVVIYRPLIEASQYISTHNFSYASKVFFETITESSKYNIGSISSIFNSIFQSFEHYQASLEVAIQKVNDGTHFQNYFLEILYSILSIIPSILIGITKPSTITFYNSLYISGAPNISQIPPGIIAAAYYSGGILWVILYAFFAGIIGKVIDRFYLSIKDKNTFASTYYVAILFIYFGFAIGGDFATVFQKSLTTFFVIYFVNKKFVKIYEDKERRLQ